VIKKKPFLYELCCTTDDDRRGQIEILRNFLVSYGVAAQDIVSFERGGRFRVCVYFTDKDKARRMQRRVNQHLSPKTRFSIRKIKNENWKTKFAKNFSIFALTKHFDVVPSWQLKQYKRTGRTAIIIDSINAFGTGLHETTSFMTQLIERMKGRFHTFLDIGTGTGLLAMVALKCGAQDILAIDLDPDAVVAAKQNFRMNGYDAAKIVKADIEKYKIKTKFDFVAANLITRDLIKFKEQILSLVTKGGYVAISGIMIENIPLIRKAFHIKKLRCIKIKKGEQWVAFLYRKVL
jgi:ribosomal protein L11 methyltransferase